MMTFLLGCILPLITASGEPDSAALLDDYSACGPNCLYAAARLMGLQVELDRVKQLVGAPRAAGNSLAEIDRAARSLGLATLAVTVDGARLASVPVPAIAHMRYSYVSPGRMEPHFILLLGAGEDHVIVLDPPLGVGAVTREKFAEAWTGNLLLFFDTAEAAEPWRVSLESTAERRWERSLLTSGLLLLLAAFVSIGQEKCRWLVRGTVYGIRGVARFVRARLGRDASSSRRPRMGTALRVLAVVVAALVPVAVGRWFSASGGEPALRTPGSAVREIARLLGITVSALRSEVRVIYSKGQVTRREKFHAKVFEFYRNWVRTDPPRECQ